MVNKKLIEMTKRQMDAKLPPRQKIQSKIQNLNLERLVDFCGVNLQRGDKEAIYDVFYLIDHSPQDFYQRNNQGRIQIKNHRVVYLDMGNDVIQEMSKNNLNQLPDSFGNLTNLEVLNLYNTNLNQLPDSFGNLTNLQRLYMDCNPNLNQLPDSFGNLTNLQVLYVRENYLNQLPDSFGNLTNLEVLDLSDNNLNQLPDSFGNLTNLQRINMKRNPLNKDSKKTLDKLKGYY